MGFTREELEKWEQEQWNWWQDQQPKSKRKTIKEQVSLILDEIGSISAGGKKCAAQTRLHEIERELDKTDLRENPPYRNGRRKLNREKTRLRKLCGLYSLSANPRPKSRSKSLSPLRIKRQVVQILKELEPLTKKRWEQYKKEGDYLE